MGLCFFNSVGYGVALLFILVNKEELGIGTAFAIHAMFIYLSFF